MSNLATPRWIVIVAAITLLAVFSLRLVAIAVVSIACFAAYNRFASSGRTLWNSSSPRCLKCGESMKSTERWCRACGSASWTRN